jgi:hypothetical protein
MTLVISAYIRIGHICFGFFGFATGIKNNTHPEGTGAEARNLLCCYFFFVAEVVLPLLLSAFVVVVLAAGFVLVVLVVCLVVVVLFVLAVCALRPSEIAAVINNMLRSLIAFIFYFLG